MRRKPIPVLNAKTWIIINVIQARQKYNIRTSHHPFGQYRKITCCPVKSSCWARTFQSSFNCARRLAKPNIRSLVGRLITLVTLDIRLHPGLSAMFSRSSFAGSHSRESVVVLASVPGDLCILRSLTQMLTGSARSQTDNNTKTLGRCYGRALVRWSGTFAPVECLLRSNLSRSSSDLSRNNSVRYYDHYANFWQQRQTAVA